MCIVSLYICRKLIHFLMWNDRNFFSKLHTSSDASSLKLVNEVASKKWTKAFKYNALPVPTGSLA